MALHLTRNFPWAILSSKRTFRLIIITIFTAGFKRLIKQYADSGLSRFYKLKNK